VFFWKLLCTSVFCCYLAFSVHAHARRGAGLPDSIASAGVTQAEWDSIQVEVRRQARRAGVAEAALLAVAERAGVNLAISGRYNATRLRDLILSQLESQARAIADLQARLEILIRAADPEIANLLASAQRAIDDGLLEDADRFLSLAEESDLAAIAIAEERSEHSRTRLAESILLRRSMDRLVSEQEMEGIRRAALTYRHLLSTTDRELAPKDWARIQFNFGIANALLAQAGNREARDLAVAALEAASEAYAIVGDASKASRARQLADALQQ
jgi:hypothetical protein